METEKKFMENVNCTLENFQLMGKFLFNPEILFKLADVRRQSDKIMFGKNSQKHQQTATNHF